MTTETRTIREWLKFAYTPDAAPLADRSIVWSLVFLLPPDDATLDDRLTIAYGGGIASLVAETPQ